MSAEIQCFQFGNWVDSQMLTFKPTVTLSKDKSFLPCFNLIFLSKVKGLKCSPPTSVPEINWIG